MATERREPKEAAREKERKAPQTDEILRNALRKAYLARAKLFVEGIKKRGVEELIEFLNQQDSKSIKWDLEKLGITAAAFKNVKNAGVEPHLVFCHPSILSLNRKSIDYYRNLSALSNKGLAQVLSGLKREQRERELVLSTAY